MRRKDTILTKGERDVLVLVALGLTNEEIADRFQMSTNKVKTFLHQACVKMEARNRAQAFISAVKQRAINVGSVPFLRGHNIFYIMLRYSK